MTRHEQETVTLCSLNIIILSRLVSGWLMANVLTNPCFLSHRRGKSEL